MQKMLFVGILLSCLISLSLQQTNLQATTATYLGTSLVGVGVGPDCILVAGNGQIQQQGFVAKLDRQGRTLLGSVAIPGNVTVARSTIIKGTLVIAVGTESGSYSVVDSNLKISSVPGEGAVTTISIGGDGTVAVLRGNSLTIYSSQGTVIVEQTFSFNHFGSVEVDSTSQSIYVIGDFDRRYGNTPVRVIALFAFDYTLKTGKWTDYDFPGSELANDLGDTTGVYVRMGRDGSLYFLGGPMGGNNIFRHSPKSLNVSANNVAIDSYNQEYNTASPVTAYIGKLNPSSGDLIAGQYLLARASTTKGNSLSPYFVDADEAGNVFFLGESACCIGKRDNVTISGQPVGPYAGGEVTLYGITSNFLKRLAWVVFTKIGGNGNPMGLSASQGVGALVANVPGFYSEVITVNALYPSHNGPAGYLVVWTY